MRDEEKLLKFFMTEWGQNVFMFGHDITPYFRGFSLHEVNFGSGDITLDLNVPLSLLEFDEQSNDKEDKE